MASSFPGMPGGSAPSAAPAAEGQGPSAPPNNSAKIPQEQAGYMELAGAQKDGDCSKVTVDGGVSLDLGCCNYFEPQDESVDRFCCGECEYGSGAQNSGEQNAGGSTNQVSNPPTAQHPLTQLRAKPKGMGR
jgi:hypothetical protein